MRRKERTLIVGRDEHSPRDGQVEERAMAPAGRHWWGRSRPSSSERESADRSEAFDRLEEREVDEEIVELLVDEAGSVALERWRDRLSLYIDQQGALDALRLRTSTEPPWPSIENPMLGYLIERGSEIGDREGVEVALAWLAANAWFEGVIAERARASRAASTKTDPESFRSRRARVVAR